MQKRKRLGKNKISKIKYYVIQTNQEILSNSMKDAFKPSISKVQILFYSN